MWLSEVTKLCPTCGLTKENSCFARHRRRPDGLQFECKACQRARRTADPEKYKAYQAAYYSVNRERVRARQKAFIMEHREEVRARQLAWYHAHPEEARANRQRWLEANREKAYAASEKWAKANPDRRREHYRRYRLKNPEKRKEYLKQRPDLVKAAKARYRAKPDTRAKELQAERRRRATPAGNEAMREYAHRRRARKRSTWVETVRLSELVRRDAGKCGLCGRKVKKQERSIDHIVPLSRGGPHSLKNTQLAHLRCNTARNNHGPAQLRLIS